MSGTSLDGVDMALVEVRGRGLDLEARFIKGLHREFGPWAEAVREVCQGKAVKVEDLLAMRAKMSQVHLQVARDLGEPFDFACVHGQTLFHRPPLTWQMVDLPALAIGLGRPVVGDLRAEDVLMGGEGAPITPLADHLTWSKEGSCRWVINLGGFVNLTTLPGTTSLEAIGGGDVCPCNQWLDEVSRRRAQRSYDEGGRLALKGEWSPEALKLLEAAWTARGRSLGTGDENREGLHFLEELSVEDHLATLVEGICRWVARWEGPRPDEVILAGGGAFNQALVEGLKRNLEPVVVMLSSDLGCPIDMREAHHMAVLGALCQDGVPITLPSVTGVEQAPLSGTWSGMGAWS